MLVLSGICSILPDMLGAFIFNLSILASCKLYFDTP